MAAGFQKIDEAGDVAFHIGQGIFRRISHTSLGGAVDDPVEALPGKAGPDRLLIGKIGVDERESRAGLRCLLAQYRETVLLELAAVIVVNRIQTDDIIAALDEGSRHMKTNETGAARDQNFQYGLPSPLC